MITVDNGYEKTYFVPSSNQVCLKHVSTKAQSLITLKNTIYSYHLFTKMLPFNFDVDDKYTLTVTQQMIT
uniref:Uncharacterized protein n=1 Tax=Acrobeloides nanus TaxID=290746 RepID=A0A914D049_9BILA